MATILKGLQKVSGSIPSPKLPVQNRFDFSRFVEGDRVLLSGRKLKLSPPLQPGKRIDISNGYVPHDAILGARPGEAVTTHKGSAIRVTFPDLDRYISMTPRKVTPVYSTYASHIASLFDIHVSAPTSEPHTESPIEILDAGTGHGSVTLHLARSIQAANSPPPDSNFEAATFSQASSQVEEVSDVPPLETRSTGAWQAWRTSRRAIVHSVEISPIYSRHAQTKVIAGFRRGIYLPHIDFHVSNVDDWITEQLQKRENEPFLSYAFLDMPDSDLQLKKVVSALKAEALLAVFVPSITQIGECIGQIKKHDLPLKWEKCVEMGEGISNGRLWDVRLATKRAKNLTPPTVREISEPERNDEELPSDDSTTDGEEVIKSEEAASSSESDPNSPTNDDQVMVCRPKVGEMIVGGGFIGLWRRKSSP